MKVTFTRTAERRYRVSVEGPDVVSSWMEPAPGYDARLPHDMAHFVVENELGLTGGVFGQLAAGGNAGGTFHPVDEQIRRKIARRGKRVAAASRQDAELSEKVIYLAFQTWNNAPFEAAPVEGVTAESIKRICREFEAVSDVWSKLAVGESMTLTWRWSPGQLKRRPRRG